MAGGGEEIFNCGLFAPGGLLSPASNAETVLNNETLDSLVPFIEIERTVCFKSVNGVNVF